MCFLFPVGFQSGLLCRNCENHMKYNVLYRNLKAKHLDSNKGLRYISVRQRRESFIRSEKMNWALKKDKM